MNPQNEFHNRNVSNDQENGSFVKKMKIEASVEPKEIMALADDLYEDFVVENEQLLKKNLKVKKNEHLHFGFLKQFSKKIKKY